MILISSLDQCFSRLRRIWLSVQLYRDSSINTCICIDIKQGQAIIQRLTRLLSTTANVLLCSRPCFKSHSAVNPCRLKTMFWLAERWSFTPYLPWIAEVSDLELHIFTGQPAEIPQHALAGILVPGCMEQTGFDWNAHEVFCSSSVGRMSNSKWSKCKWQFIRDIKIPSSNPCSSLKQFSSGVHRWFNQQTGQGAKPN